MQPPVAPIALDYLASALVESGCDTDVLDLCFSADWAAAIDDYPAGDGVSLVALTLRNTDDTYFASQDFFLPRFREVAGHLKRRFAAPLCLGGSGFSVMPEAVLAYCGLDLGIWGEGEVALPMLARRVTAGEDYRDVPGLVYRSGEGFGRNPPRYLGLEGAPAPRRDAVDNRRYFAEGGMAGIETKRGCDRHCIYCADPVGKGRKVRLRSPQAVADEVEALLAMGIDHLHLCDSEFNLPPSHAEAVCRELIERGLGQRVRWYAYCSPVPFSDELAGLFLKAGCAGINFGADSAADTMLRTLGRDHRARDVAETARICTRQGLVFMYDLLLGGPGETRASLRETVEVMKRLSPARVGAALGLRIFPGTPIAAMVRASGPLAANPNVHGAADEGFLAPTFYLSAALGEDAADYLARVIGGDERFFFGEADAGDQNYNYNQNDILVRAIRDGHRGAFWDILRRLAGE